MARPRKYNISLTDDEVKKLKSIMHKKQTSKTVRNRCQIILDLDDAHGKVLTHEQSAKTNCVCMATIMNTVKLYSEKGIQGIVTLNRNVNSDNAHRKLDGHAEARRIIKRLENHYTPKHGSWLDMAEIELNVMTRQCLSRRIASIEKLKCELSAWERERNCNTAKIQWHFQTGDAREKLISLFLEG